MMIVNGNKERIDYLRECYFNDIDYKTVPRTLHEQKYVYVIKNDTTGLSKIGITGNLHERTIAIQAQSGVPLKIVNYILLEGEYDESAKYIEGWLHLFFKEKRKKGEWFLLNVFDLLQIEHLFRYTIEGEWVSSYTDTQLHDYIKNQNFIPV